MTTLLLLRHSIPERGGSSPDPGLSAEGLQRAAAVFQNDAFRTVSLVWSSPSLRALQTAQLLGLPVRQAPALPSAAPAIRPGRTLRSGNANTKTRTSKIRTASPSVRSEPDGRLPPRTAGFAPGGAERPCRLPRRRYLQLLAALLHR